MTLLSKFLTSVVLIFASAFVFAATAKATVHAPYLYRVSRNGVDSLLIGTIHAGVSLEDFIEEPQISQAIKNSKQLIVEWPFSKPEVVQFLDHVSEAILTNPEIAGIPGTQGELAPDEIERLVQIGIPREVGARLHEGQCLVLMTASVLFPRPKALDFEILRKAYQSNVPVVALDSRELIQKATSKKSDAGNAPASPKNTISKWLAKYSNEELMGMAEKYLRKPYLDGSSVKDRIPSTVAVRNQAWLLKLDQLLEKNSVVAVGAAHLYGDTGLIRLLESKGFSVEKLQSAERIK